MARKIKSLIFSNCILDTDIGILKLIEFDYRNSDIFLDDILDHTVLEKQQYLEYTRVHPNPLSVVVRESDWDKIDSLYFQFIEKENDRIIDLSCNTLMIDVMKLIIMGDTPMEVTLLCNTQHEADVLSNRLSLFGVNNIHILVEPNHDKIDLEQFDDIYVKYISDLDGFRKIANKTIYISDHGLNTTTHDIGIDKFVTPNVDALKYMVDNIVNLFSLYSFDKELIMD